MRRRRQVLLGLGAGVAVAASLRASVPIPPVRRAVELTYLKSNAGMRDQLRRFIVLNWFAMDKIAKERGLMQHFRVLDTGSDDGEWNVLVVVTYLNDRGYDGIKPEFEAIRTAHQTVLIDGKSLSDLGRVVKGIKTFEDLGEVF
jgi:hypothetical protein